MMYTSAAQAASGCSCVLPMRSEVRSTGVGVGAAEVGHRERGPCSRTVKLVNTVGKLQESIEPARGDIHPLVVLACRFFLAF